MQAEQTHAGSTNSVQHWRYKWCTAAVATIESHLIESFKVDSTPVVAIAASDVAASGLNLRASHVVRFRMAPNPMQAVRKIQIPPTSCRRICEKEIINVKGRASRTAACS